MGLQIQETEDGSHTLYWEEKNEHYHSTHGSVQEARKVYIESAFLPAVTAFEEGKIEKIRIFEMGFGTGLNTLLTLTEATRRGLPVEYTTIEANPVPEVLWRQLNYPRIPDLAYPDSFENIHRQDFDGKPYTVTPFFTLAKLKGDIREVPLPEACFNVIYYDAFAPSVQPGLWELPVFARLKKASASPCFLSTYCAQGQFRRNLKQAGFTVESLPGPAGKREMTRGIIY